MHLNTLCSEWSFICRVRFIKASYTQWEGELYAYSGSLYTRFNGTVSSKKSSRLMFWKQWHCVGEGVPEWRHLIQFLPVEYHDRRVKTPLWTNLTTRFTDSYWHHWIQTTQRWHKQTGGLLGYLRSRKPGTKETQMVQHVCWCVSQWKSTEMAWLNDETPLWTNLTKRFPDSCWLQLMSWHLNN